LCRSHRMTRKKPRFAGLRPGRRGLHPARRRLRTVQLPRTLGTTATGGDGAHRIGRFGPYSSTAPVRLAEGRRSLHHHPRIAHSSDPPSDRRPNRIIQDFVADEDLQGLNGRYGPYITDGAKNARVPKDRDPRPSRSRNARPCWPRAGEECAGRFGAGCRRRQPSASATAGAPAGVAEALGLALRLALMLAPGKRGSHHGSPGGRRGALRDLHQ